MSSWDLCMAFWLGVDDISLGGASPYAYAQGKEFASEVESAVHILRDTMDASSTILASDAHTVVMKYDRDPSIVQLHLSRIG